MKKTLITIGILFLIMVSISILWVNSDNKQKENEILEGYVLTKYSETNVFQVAISQELPEQELENLDGNDIRNMATEDESLVLVLLDKPTFNQIKLGDKLIIEHNGVFLESSPPKVGAISVKIETIKK